MKQHLYSILFFCIVGLFSPAHAQTYIQGKDVLPFAQIATSTLLQANKRLPVEQANTLREKLEEKKYPQLNLKPRGEHYLINGFLVSVVCSDMVFLKQKKYPGIYKNYLYLQQRVHLANRYLEYKDLGTHQIMVSYGRTGNGYIITRRTPPMRS